MKRNLFHLAAYGFVVVFSEEVLPNGFLSSEGLSDGGFSGEVLSDGLLASTSCTVSKITINPNQKDVYGSYEGTLQKARDCKSLAVFDGDFWLDDFVRGNPDNRVAIPTMTACCLADIKCGPTGDGYCISEVNPCVNYDIPFENIGIYQGPSKYCPGNYSKCCPKVGSTKKSVSMEDDYNNIIAQGNSESSYFTTGGEEIALGLGTTNPNDWTIPPLDGENLYLSNEGTANEGTDQYGLIAGLGDSSGWGDEGTA